MRKFLSTAIAVMAYGLLSAGTASAAAKWECTGPAYVCGHANVTASKAKANSAKAYKSNKSYAYKAKSGHKTASYAKKSSGSVATGNSGGGSSSGGSRGMASYYSEPQALASGGRFNPNALTAAHKTLPFGTRVLVTNLNNGRSVTVTINDRGPFVKGRVIDLSRRAAQVVGMTGSGVAPVSYTVVGRS